MTRRVFNALVIFFFAFTQFVFAQTSKQEESVFFSDARASYFKLRNNDPGIVRVGDWEAAQKRLEEVARSTPSDSEAAEALFHVAVIKEHLAKAGRLPIESAIQTYTALVKRYPRSEWADDALLKAGDLFLLEVGDVDSAQRVYRNVIERFASSDSAQAAELKLNALAHGKAKGIEPQKPGRSSLARPRWGAKRTVVLDPGHGGEDVGGRGVGGLLEKDVTLSVALEVERLIQEELGAKVVLTRRGDTFVPLADRTSTANASSADVFVSIHTNASPDGALHGLQTFYLDTTNDEASRLLAERENGSLKLEGQDMDLAFILSDLTQHAKLGPSIELGVDIQKSILKSASKHATTVKDLGVRKAPFYVLVGARMPCVLVELLFIDHPVDGELLADGDFRSSMARGIYQGIYQFLSRVEPE